MLVFKSWLLCVIISFCFFKQKTAYYLRISDWSSDVCSSDLLCSLAGKPFMEVKAVLFKRFADVDCIDLEVDTKNVDEFIGAVRYLGPSFGGINLEAIAAPDCFIIESRLREIMNIPVFHDDHPATALITPAVLINALFITSRDIKKTARQSH